MSDEKKIDEKTSEPAEDEAPAVDAEAAAAEPDVAPEPEPAAEAEVVTEPEAEAEAEVVTEAEPEGDAEAPAEPEADAAVPEPEASAEAPAAEEPAGESVEAEAAAVPVEKKKRKRLPRAQRPQKTRRKREPATARKPIVRLEKPESERGRRQERLGTVVSDAMDKTIVVKVDMIKAHPKYKKVVRRSTKFHAHDESNEAKIGDVVRIVETRPLSKSKRWRLAEVVEVAK